MNFSGQFKWITNESSERLFLLLFTFILFQLPVSAQTGSPCNLNPFATVTLEPDFELVGAGENIDTIDFWDTPDANNTLMFVTAKDNSLIEVWQYPFVGNQIDTLEHSTFGESKVNGVVVDQEEDLLYVSIGESINTVSVFSLPDLTFIHNFNKPGVKLGREPNITLLELPSGDKRIYVSSKTTVYIHQADSGNFISEFTPGRIIETMAADNFHQVIYIPDETEQTGIYAYHPNGDPYERNGTNNFGNNGIFDEDAEGIWLYRCTDENGEDNGSGLIVVSDQRQDLTDFEVFDRLSWEHLGTFNINGVTNTDGISSFQGALPDYPEGVFVAINDDSETAGVGWRKIFDAIGAIVAIDDPVEEIRNFHISSNYPNPFNPGTTITYQIPKNTRTKLTIYNILGQPVRELLNQQQQAGEHQVYWDGLDDNALPVSSGIYIYKFTTPEYQYSGKMTLMR